MISFAIDFAKLNTAELIDQLQNIVDQQISGQQLVTDIHIDNIELGSVSPAIRLIDIQRTGDCEGRSHTETALKSSMAIVSIDFDSEEFKIDMSAELNLNYPSPRFMSLPIQMSLSKLKIAAELMVQHDGITLKSNPHEIKFDVAVNIGDEKQLKSVNKIEQFVKELFYKILDEKLVYPNSIPLQLIKPMPVELEYSDVSEDFEVVD